MREETEQTVATLLPTIGGIPTYTLRRRVEPEEEQPELLSCAKLRKWLEDNSPYITVPQPTGRVALSSLLGRATKQRQYHLDS